MTCLTNKNMIKTRSDDMSISQNYNQDKVRWHVSCWQKYDHNKVRWHVSCWQKYDHDKVRWHVELTKIWSNKVRWHVELTKIWSNKVRWHVELTKIWSWQGQVTCRTYKNMITTRSGDKSNLNMIKTRSDDMSNLQKYDHDKIRWYVKLTKIWSWQGQVTCRADKNIIKNRWHMSDWQY